MNIAYIILVHKDPKQIKRLIDSIKDTGDFYLHVDKKSDVSPFEKELKEYENVYFTSKRYSVWWAGFSMIKGYMQGFLDAYNSDKKYDRFVMLTGQDYPLMTNKEILDTFERNKETEYVMAYNIINSTVPTDKNKILKKWYLDFFINSNFLSKCYRSFIYRTVTKYYTGKEIRVPLNNILVEPYFGQMLSAFTRKGAELILNTYLNDKKFNKVMKHVYAAVEIYWQTVIFNSPLRKNTVQNGEEHEITEHFGWAPLHYHNYDVDTSVYTKDDFDELKSCGYMFCRKVVPGISDELMDMIDDMRKEKEKQ